MAVLLSAQEDRFTPPENLFAEMDANGDGAIDEEEFLAVAEEAGSDISDDQLKEVFAELDANGDGSVDQEEFMTAAKDAAPPRPAGDVSSEKDDEEYDTLDTNQDGVVSLAELLAAGIGTEGA